MLDNRVITGSGDTATGENGTTTLYNTHATLTHINGKSSLHISNGSSAETSYGSCCILILKLLHKIIIDLPMHNSLPLMDTLKYMYLKYDGTSTHNSSFGVVSGGNIHWCRIILKVNIR